MYIRYYNIAYPTRRLYILAIELLLVHPIRYLYIYIYNNIMFTILVLHYAEAYTHKYTIICKYVERNAIVLRWTRLPQQCIPETIQNSRTPTCGRQPLNLYVVSGT